MERRHSLGPGRGADREDLPAGVVQKLGFDLLGRRQERMLKGHLRKALVLYKYFK